MKKNKLTPEQRSEAIRIRNAEYYQKNKEARRIRNAEYYEKNKEVVKKQYQSKTKDYWSVYILPKANYVGITRNIYKRMSTHKALGRDITDYRILHEIENEEDARRQEDLYHRIGFEGGNGRRGINKNKNVFEVRVKDDNQTLYAITETLEDAYQCRTEFYNQDKNLWTPKFEIDRLK
jgi:hypothetical protein